MFDHPIIAAIQAHAIAEYPRESCGLVVGDAYRPCANIHPKPLENFLVAEADYADDYIAGRVQAVVHSHPNGPDHPTASDMEYQVAAMLPCGIVCTDGTNVTKPFWFGDQAPMPPLIGRGFRHGVTDCLSIIRDWYWSERQVRIPEFPRDWEWWLETGDQNPNFYRDCFDAAGFVEVDDGPEIGDVFRVKIRSETPNHAGIFVGNSLGLHHLTSRLPVDHKRLSARVPLGSFSNLIREHRWLRLKG